VLYGPGAKRDDVVTVASTPLIIYAANYARVLSISQTSGVLHSESIAGNRVLEYTAAGSNTDKNASVLSDVRMGAGKTAGACAACRAAGVGLEFLAAKKHSRKGAAKCQQIREEWRAANSE